MSLRFSEEATSFREIERLFAFLDQRKIDDGYGRLVPTILSANMQHHYPEVVDLFVPEHILTDAEAALSLAENLGVVSVYRFKPCDYAEDPDLAKMGANYIARIGPMGDGEGTRQWIPADTRVRAILLAVVHVFRELSRATQNVPKPNRTRMH